MSTIHEIKALQAHGWSVSAIAAELQVDRKTVRKYLQQADFSVPPPAAASRSSKLDPYKSTIDEWLGDDAHQWYKQRHTAQRIYDRLPEAFPGFSVSYPTVRRYVRQRHRTAPATGTLELVWEPGEAAPVDFGQADVIEQGGRVRMHFLCVSFPYSNAGYLQLFRGENAECVVQGLVDILQHIEGAPHRLIFDHASGVGRRMGETVRMTELFQRFPAHYGFATTFCNPAAGYEKGRVENNVGFQRRNLLVPPPPVSDVVATNRERLPRSEQHWQRVHYNKGRTVADLFGDERHTFRALPPRRLPPIDIPGSARIAQGAFASRASIGIPQRPRMPSKP